MRRLFVVVTLLSALLCSCCRVTKAPWERQPHTFIAHRGAHFEGTPENTIAGIVKAKEMNFPMIEIDVRCTVDSVLIVMHDRFLNRTCVTRDQKELEEPVMLNKLTWEEMNEAYCLKGGENIPLFDDFLASCKENGIYPMIHYNDGSIAKTVEVAQKYFGADYIFFGAFEHCAEARRLDPNCMILADFNNKNYDTVLDDLTALGGYNGVSTMWTVSLTKEFVEKAHSMGIKVQTSLPKYTATDTLKLNNVDYILTDYFTSVGELHSDYESLAQ
jgi:glycerophosphoryl diester phosphodiesterase